MVQEWDEEKGRLQVYQGGQMRQPFLSSLVTVIVPTAGPSVEGGTREGQTERPWEGETHKMAQEGAHKPHRSTAIMSRSRQRQVAECMDFI